MKKRPFAIAFAAVLLFLAKPVGAVEWTGPSAVKGIKKVNQTGMQFLKIGQSARAAGMGDAFAAVSDDVNAAFYNAAGLTRVKRFGYQANYSRWLAGSNTYSMAVAWNTGTTRGEVIGFTLMAFKPEDMEETTILKPDGIGQKIRYSDMAVGLLYALRFTDRFSFGARLTYAREQLYTSGTSVLAFDLGTFFDTGFRSLRLAMALRNFGPDRRADALPYMLPLHYSMAVAAEILGQKEKPFSLTLNLESAFAVDYEQRYLVGAEAWIWNTLALRAGWKQNYDLERFTLGAGFRKDVRPSRALTLDVAYGRLKKKDGIQIFDPILRVSLGGTF